MIFPGTVWRKSQSDQVGAYTGLQHYIGRWIVERRTKLGPDLISRMVNSKVAGRPIGQQELAAMMVNFIFGGWVTVVWALSFTARCLAENPAIRRQLRDNPQLISAVIEELLRRFGIPNTARVIVGDMQ